jgi:hypothetical protein
MLFTNNEALRAAIRFMRRSAGQADTLTEAR